MHRASEEQLREIYLTLELESGISTIQSGLAVLQQGYLYRRNDFLFMLLLATGLERMMKVVLHLHHYEASGEFRAIWKTHNLDRLRKRIVGHCFTEDYLRRTMARQDCDFMTSDPLLLDTFKVLTNFANRDRYLYMDSITDPALPNVADRWPSRQWAKLETGVIGSLDLVITADTVEATHLRASREILIVIERFTRALGRLLTHGALGEQGKSLSHLFADFRRLNDEQLGSHEYRV